MPDLDGKVVRGLNIDAVSFRNSFKALPGQKIKDEVLATIRSLLGLDLDQAPAGLHLHQLKGKQVLSVKGDGTKVSAWTLHVTADDAYKASFTYEFSTFHFRLVDTHAVIDKRP